ncbi:MAG TPA: chemotaxis protein CheW [Gemmatimonadaceae bacterium]
MTPSTANPELAGGQALDFRERVRQRTGSEELLTFRIGREWFALELAAVAEIVEGPDVRPVPEAPGVLLGVFSHHDVLISLYSGAGVLGADSDDETTALVLAARGGRFALAVDDVDDVVRIPLADLRQPPRGTADDEVLAGLVWRDGRLISVIHARALLAACCAQPEEAA